MSQGARNLSNGHETFGKCSTREMDRSSKSQPDPVSLDACPMIFSLRDQNIYDGDEERTRRRGSEHFILPARDQKKHQILEKNAFFYFVLYCCRNIQGHVSNIFLCVLKVVTHPKTF